MSFITHSYCTEQHCFAKWWAWMQKLLLYLWALLMQHSHLTIPSINIHNTMTLSHVPLFDSVPAFSTGPVTTSMMGSMGCVEAEQRETLEVRAGILGDDFTNQGPDQSLSRYTILLAETHGHGLGNAPKCSYSIVRACTYTEEFDSRPSSVDAGSWRSTNCLQCWGAGVGKLQTILTKWPPEHRHAVLTIFHTPFQSRSCKISRHNTATGVFSPVDRRYYSQPHHVCAWKFPCHRTALEIHTNLTSWDF